MAKIPATPAQLAIAALKGAAITSHDAARVVRAYLERVEKFEPEDVALCTGKLLDKLRGVPVSDTIYRDGRNRLIVRGKVASEDVAKGYMHSAVSLLRNPLRKLVGDKIDYATAMGMRNATTVYDIVFFKAAAWWHQQENNVLKEIIGVAGDSSPQGSDE